MKRWRTVATGVAVTALVASASGCGGPLDPKTGDPDTLVVHSRFAPGTDGAETYGAIVKQFERENPGLRIKNLYNGDEIFNAFETSRLADKEADVLLINLYDKAYSWTDLKATPPVNRYLKKWRLKNRVQPQALEAWTDDKGRLRAFPWTGFSWPILVNGTLLHKAGIKEPPRTMAQLHAALKAFKAAKIAPMTIGGNDWSGQKFLMQVMQSYMTPKVTKRVFAKGNYCAEPRALKGLTLFKELRDAGLFVKGAQGMNADQMNADYLEQRAAMMPAISSTTAAVPPSLAGQTKIAGFPVPSDGTYDKPTVYNGSTATGIWITPNGTKKLDLSEKFVKFLYRKDVVQKFIDKSGYVMVMRDQRPSKERPLVSKSSKITHGDTVSEAVMPDDYVPPEVSTALERATSLAYSQGASVQAMCKALDTAYRS